MQSFQKKKCPQCGLGTMKNWRNLTTDQKILVEKLPLNTEFSPEERKTHSFCERCWFERFNNQVEQV